MRRYFVIHARRRWVGDQVLRQLEEIYSTPECDEIAYHVRVRDDSPEHPAIIKVLHDAGCVPHRQGTEYGPGIYDHQANYEYEPEDYAAAHLFQMIPTHQLSHVNGRNEDGLLRVNLKSAKGKADLLTTHTADLLVSDSLKSDLDAENFIGLAFRPTVLVKGDYSTKFEELPWSKARRSPLWELTASLVLPPLANRVEREGHPRSLHDDEWVDGKWRGGYLFEAGEYDGKPKFHREAIEAMGPFDFALTYEPYRASTGLNLLYHRTPLMKRRAYDFIRKRFKRTYWWPFYLVDE